MSKSLSPIGNALLDGVISEARHVMSIEELKRIIDQKWVKKDNPEEKEK